jgi:hypothetical protein
VREAVQNKYGCRLIGAFTVKEVPGNFHVSCHAYFNHYMQVQAEGLIESLNTSHIIHKLYFGREHHLTRIKRQHPEASLHILEGHRSIGDSSFHYHIDIVPTWYHESAISSYYTYQYTYKENSYPSRDQPPVVHFNYAIGGLSVEIKPREEDFSDFLVHLCAILGGIYAIARAVHNLLGNFGPRFEYQLIE